MCLMWGSPCDEGRLKITNDKRAGNAHGCVSQPGWLRCFRETACSKRLQRALIRMRSRHSLADPSITPRFILR
jgi:hypothetical protein